MEYREQNQFYYIKMAGKTANLNLVRLKHNFYEKKTFHINQRSHYIIKNRLKNAQNLN